MHQQMTEEIQELWFLDLGWQLNRATWKVSSSRPSFPPGPLAKLAQKGGPEQRAGSCVKEID